MPGSVAAAGAGGVHQDGILGWRAVALAFPSGPGPAVVRPNSGRQGLVPATVRCRTGAVGAALVLAHHVSVRHAVAILEARDHLLSLGISVDDQPPSCPERADDPWGVRSEPDLAVYHRERVWPVEVQRDIRMSNLSKWVKSLELFQRLVLVTFCTDRLERQCRMLSEARAQYRLPDYPVLLASLEGWEDGDRQFLSV